MRILNGRNPKSITHHMKPLRLLFLFVGIVLFALCARSALRGPSDILAENRYPSAGMTFVLSAFEDLRELYCDKEILKDREKRNVCRTDTTWRSKLQRDIAVTPTTTVLNVIHEIGMTNWSGGMQARVIKKNAILQSPYLGSLKSSAETQRFAQTLIAPGDIIVICPYSE
jgi:hypothetical protein